MKRQRRETRRERQRCAHDDQAARDVERLIQQKLAERERQSIETGRQFNKMLNLGTAYGMSPKQFIARSKGKLTESLLESWKDSWPELHRTLAEPKPEPVLIETDYAALELRVLNWAKGDAEFTAKLFNAVYPSGLDEPPQEAIAQETPPALDR